MQNPTQRRSHPYLMGIITGVSLTVAAASMMGQSYDKRPTQPANPPGASNPRPAETPPGAPMGAVVADVDQFYVTTGNTSGNSARLWKRPAGKGTLEYIGEFQANAKGR